MRSLLAVLILVAFPSLSLSDDWTPPENPDVSAILQSASTDARQGDYEIALQKHIWYHNNALKYQRSQYGVRLSFALSDWKRLGKKYPKAMKALEKIRDDNEQAFLDGKASPELFHDVMAINRTLNEQDKTVKLFSKLDKKNNKMAKIVYRYAEESLIEEKEFELCSKYMDAEKTLESIKLSYKRLNDYYKKSKARSQFLNMADQILEKRAKDFILILVNTDQKDLANKAAKELKALTSNKGVHSAIDEALIVK